jgi:hypothetical protein
MPDDPPTSVLITDALARRLWPSGDAVGHRFRETPTAPWNTVIGVVGHVRTAEDGTHGPTDSFQVYIAQRPPPPPTAAAVAPPRRGNFAGPAFGFLVVTARVDSRARTSDLYQTVRSVDPRNILKLDFVDDLYALQFADRLLAMQVVSGFGLLAFVVAVAGIYGLMAFLVVARAREIGIRMALGADARAVRRLVMQSSAKLVLTGLALGVGGALVASRWVQSQLFGVSAMDPVTFAGVSASVTAVALLATWRPASNATRVDPTALLRN